jgi:hypothetical protein
MAYSYFPVPVSLKREHEEILADLSRASREGGRLGAAAEVAQSLVIPHTQREEEFALTPLSLLRALADDRVSEDMEPVLLMLDRLRRWMPEMISDHRAIAGAMKELGAAAMDEGKPEFAGMVPRVLLHAEMEEEVLYPASIPAGEYVGLRL